MSGDLELYHLLCQVQASAESDTATIKQLRSAIVERTKQMDSLHVILRSKEESIEKLQQQHKGVLKSCSPESDADNDLSLRYDQSFLKSFDQLDSVVEVRLRDYSHRASRWMETVMLSSSPPQGQQLLPPSTTDVGSLHRRARTTPFVLPH